MSLIPSQTTLTRQASDSIPRWINDGAQAIVAHGWLLQLESPKSIQQVYQKQGRFCTNSHVGHEMEYLIKDAFVDDLYDGKLHCLTVRDRTKHEQAAGVIFWRDVPVEEMSKWMKPSFMEEIMNSQKQLISISIPQIMSPTKTSISTSISTSHNAFNNTSSNNIPTSTSKYTPTSTSTSSSTSPSTSTSNGILGQTSQQICSDWIKIELVGTHPDYFGQRIGTVLMLACLVYAAKNRQQHSILHVAGGENNIPATSLYKRFGFIPVAPHHFNRPNNNIYVLPNIYHTLENIDWKHFLSSTSTSNVENEEEKMKLIENDEKKEEQRKDQEKMDIS